MTPSTETHVDQRTKVDRYGWTVVDRPGVPMDVGKDELVIDETYQRTANDAKIRLIVREWSWIACGSILVADRQNAFYVIDGQHRVLAARRRTDITQLPCLVFETQSAVAEAKGFLQANTQRKPITGVDRFRALVVTNDPHALLVKRLCDQVGREVKTSPSPSSVRCVATMLRHASNAPAVLERLWPVLHTLMDRQSISERLLDALMYIEQRMPNGESLVDRKWRDRLTRIGAEKMIEGATKAAAFYARGGSKVWAYGVVQALNYNHRIRLTLDGEEADPGSKDG